MFFSAAMLCCNAMLAQTQPTPKPSAEMLGMQKEAETLQYKMQVDWAKIKDLVEVTNYLDDYKQMQDLQKRYSAAAVKQQEAAKAPAKPEAPKPPDPVKPPTKPAGK